MEYKFHPQETQYSLETTITVNIVEIEFMKHQLTLDHVVPKSRMGPKTWNNLVACCVPCNQKKGDRTPTEASMPLIRQPSAPHHMLWTSVDWMMRKHGRRELPLSWKNF